MQTKFDYYMPVNIITGADCVKLSLKKTIDTFSAKERCLIVTGKNSARLSGALDDVCSILVECGTEYILFDEIIENPPVSICDRGARMAIECEVEFIIGIGGGSVLDAAKAIAALAANSDVRGETIFEAELKQSLPLIVVPTTAGTGSEANNYSVLSLDGQNKKRTFKNRYSYPNSAFLDAKYTQSLDGEYTLSTTLDAFCHCLESYLSPKSTVFSEAAAVFGASQIWEVLDENYVKNKKRLPNYNERETLLYASCAAGAAINTTGTGFPHPMGYNLTMYGNIPHGRACAAFTGAFIEYNKKNAMGAERIDGFSARSGILTEDIKTVIPALASVQFMLSDEDTALFIKTVRDAGNFMNSPYVIDEHEMEAIYKGLF